MPCGPRYARSKLLPAILSNSIVRLSLLVPINGPATLRVLCILVGVERFELPTSCSQSRRATRLRYTPNIIVSIKQSICPNSLRALNTSMFHIDRVERLLRASCPSPLLHPSLGSALRASLRLFKFIPDECVDPIEFSPVPRAGALPLIISLGAIPRVLACAHARGGILRSAPRTVKTGRIRDQRHADVRRHGTDWFTCRTGELHETIALPDSRSEILTNVRHHHKR